MSFERILVPTDFSADARAAAEIALSLAERDGAELVLLHVSELPDYAFMAVEPVYLPQKAWEYLWEREQNKIDEKLDELTQQLRALGSGAATITAKVRRAGVVEGINDFAAEVGCDLMVIGSQGEDAGPRYWFGGHAPKVARDAPCPVMLVRSGAKTSIPTHALVAVDYSRFSQPAAQLARRVIAPAGKLTFCHVWQQPPLIAVEPHDEFTEAVEKARAAEARRMDEFVEALDLGQTAAASVVDIGNPARRILDSAGEREADVIVLGSHGRTGIERVIGTVADRVLRHAEVPVLLLPERSLQEVDRAAQEDPR